MYLGPDRPAGGSISNPPGAPPAILSGREQPATDSVRRCRGLAGSIRNPLALLYLRQRVHRPGNAVF